MKNSIAFFDLDHTLLIINSSFYFGKYLYKIKKLSLYSIIKLVIYYSIYKIGLISLYQLHDYSFLIFKGKNKQQYEKLAEEFVSIYFNSIVSKEMFQIFKKFKNKNIYTVIISSSPNFLVNAFKKYFQPDFICSTLYNIDSYNNFSNVSICDGKDKATFVHSLAKKLSIAVENTYAFSDSLEDMPFLEAVGHSTVVNPSSSLKKISIKNKWKILNL